MIRTLLALLLLVPAAHAAHAAELMVDGAFSRATPGSGPGVAYLTIHGGDAADRLLAVSSPRAATVSLHSMVMQGSVMRMRQLDAIEVPAGSTVALAPNQALHLMLEGLKTPLRKGETVPLVLRFERAGERRVEAMVEGPGALTPSAEQGNAR